MRIAASYGSGELNPAASTPNAPNPQCRYRFPQGHFRLGLPRPTASCWHRTTFSGFGAHILANRSSQEPYVAQSVIRRVLVIIPVSACAQRKHEPPVECRGLFGGEPNGEGECRRSDCSSFNAYMSIIPPIPEFSRGGLAGYLHAISQGRQDNTVFHDLGLLSSAPTLD